MNYLKVYDFKSDNDCFLVQIESKISLAKLDNLSTLPCSTNYSNFTLEKVRPCQPTPTYTFTHNETDFKRFVPLPFYSNDLFGDQRWHQIKKALQLISSRQAPTIKELLV